eukprot:6193088-Pleurochrysis_carterae.AAC.2
MGANTSRAEGETSLSWSYKGPGNPLSKRRTHSYSTKASRVRPAPLDESQAQQVQRKPLHESWGGIGRTLQQVTRTTADTSASTEERRSSLNAAETVATPEQWLCKLLRRSRTLKTLSEAEAERFTKPGDEDGFTRQERIYSLVAKLGTHISPPANALVGQSQAVSHPQAHQTVRAYVRASAEAVLQLHYVVALAKT